MYSTSLLTKTQQRREEFCNFILLFAVWSCNQTVMLLIINWNISIFLVKLFCLVFSSYSFQRTFSWSLKVSLYPTALLFAFHCTAFCVACWKVSIFFSPLSRLSSSFVQRKYWIGKIIVMSFLFTDCDPLLQPIDQRHLFFEWRMC